MRMLHLRVYVRRYIVRRARIHSSVPRPPLALLQDLALIKRQRETVEQHIRALERDSATPLPKTLAEATRARDDAEREAQEQPEDAAADGAGAFAERRCVYGNGLRRWFVVRGCEPRRSRCPRSYHFTTSATPLLVAAQFRSRRSLSQPVRAWRGGAASIAHASSPPSSPSPHLFVRLR